MARKSLLDSTGYAALVDAEDNFIELYEAVSSTSAGTPWQNAIFVGKSGDDNNNGTMIGSPKLTFAAAINAANAGTVVICLDAGTYAEDINCKAGVDVYAPNASLSGNITLAQHETVCFRSVASSAGNAIQKPAGTTDGICHVILRELSLSLAANGVACLDTGSTIHVIVDELSVATGVGIGSKTDALGKHAVRVGKIKLTANNGTAIATYGSSALVTGYIGSIVEDGVITGTVGLDAEGGEISVFIGKNGADTKTTGSGTVNGFEPTSGTVAEVTGGSISGVTITGSSINGSDVGTSVPAAGAFTSIKDTGLIASKPVFTDADKILTNAGTMPISQGGTGETTASAAFNALKQAASTSFEGVVELATTSEAVAGTDTSRAVTPAGLKAAIDNIDTETIPPGLVAAFAMETPPDGWLECDGSAISRSTYSSLYSAIGVRFGIGDGSTTFNLPDFRGQFLRGWDHGAGVDPDAASRTDAGDGTVGDKVGTKQADTIRSHYHTFGGYEVVYGGTDYYTDLGANYGGARYGLHDLTKTASAGDNETRPTNVNVMYCIKY